MTRLNSMYIAFTARSAVLISLALTAVLAILLSRVDTLMAGPDGMGVVYLQLSFSRVNFESVIASWGPGGMYIFLQSIWLDFIYPPAYATLLSSAPAFFSAKGQDFSIESISSAEGSPVQRSGRD